MRRGFNRRDFLKRVGAGAAVVTAPALLTRCARDKGAVKPDSAGSGAHTTYFDAFGVDSGVLQRVLAKGLASGGDFSEVFLEHTIVHWIGMEDARSTGPTPMSTWAPVSACSRATPPGTPTART